MTSTTTSTKTLDDLIDHPDDAAAQGDRLGGASDIDGFVLWVAGFSVTRTGEEWRVVASGG